MCRLLAVIALLAATAGVAVEMTTSTSFTPHAEDCYFVEVTVPVVAPNAHVCPPPSTIGIGRW